MIRLPLTLALLLLLGGLMAAPASGQADSRHAEQVQPEDDEPVKDPALRRVFSSLAMLLLSGLLVLIFAIGAYLLIRVGRTVAQKPPPSSPTSYVDAWSGYRLSDEQVDAAMRDLKAEHGVSDELPPDEPAGGSPGSGPAPPK